VRESEAGERLGSFIGEASSATDGRAR
jgi:hypothetical protein